jgi:hypothetical protein
MDRRWHRQSFTKGLHYFLKKIDLMATIDLSLLRLPNDLRTGISAIPKAATRWMSFNQSNSRFFSLL